MRPSLRSIVFLLFIGHAAICLPSQEVDPNKTGGSHLTRADLANLFSKERRIAYLVAISDYDLDSTGFPSLKYPVKDAVEVEKTLRQQGYSVLRIQEDEATAGRIRADLRNYAKAFAEGDGEGSFVFYFSGHGYAIGDRNYLATYGTQAQSLDREGLSVTEVDTLLAGINVRDRTAFIDACRDDPDKTKGLASAATSIVPFKPSGSTDFLFSTQKGQVSREDRDLGQGVFTYYLVEGLRGGAAGPDGFISWSDLQKYVQERMDERSLNLGIFQIPYNARGSAVDFVIARAHLDPIPAPVANVPRIRVSNQITHIADFGAAPISTSSPPGLRVFGVSPDGRLLAYSSGTIVSVRNVADGSWVADLSGPAKPIRTLEFSPDSKLIAAGADDQSLWLWEIASSASWQLQDKGLKLVNAISFSADRLFLATASSDKTVRVWDIAKREVAARSIESSGMVGIAIRPDPKSNTVAFWGNSGSVRIWNWASGVPAVDFMASGRVRSLSYSRDGQRLAVGLDNGSIEVRPVSDILRATVLTGHEAAVDFVLFSRDGGSLVSTSSDRTFRSWNIQAAEQTRSTEAKQGMQVVSLIFIEDGRLFALALRSGRLELWGVPSP